MSEEVKEEYNEEEILILLHEVLAKLDRLEKAVRKVVDKEIEEENNKLQEQLSNPNLNPTIQAAFTKLGPIRFNKPDLKVFPEGVQIKKDSIEKALDDFEQNMPDILKEREKAYKEANVHEKFK